MLELINQLDGFDPRGNIKVLMATNRPDTLDPALVRPGRLDRRVEFALPDLEGRTHIFKIHAKQMSVDRDIRYDLLARLCPNTTGTCVSWRPKIPQCVPHPICIRACVQALKFARCAPKRACSRFARDARWPLRKTFSMQSRRSLRATRSSRRLLAMSRTIDDDARVM